LSINQKKKKLIVEKRVIVERSQKRKTQKQKPKKRGQTPYSGIVNSFGGFASANKTVDRVVELEANEDISLTFGTGANVFTNKSLFINPANAVLFPVFSNIAQCYTSWKLVSMKVSYLTESHPLSATASGGHVLLVINYDPQEAPFADYLTAAAYNPRSETVPFQSTDITCNMKGGEFKNGHMNREYKMFPSNNASIPTGVGASVEDYNLGLLQLIVNNTLASNTTEIGKFHVSARFKMSGLHKPVAGTYAPVLSIVAPAITTSNSFTTGTVVAGSTATVTPVFTNQGVQFFGIPVGTRLMISTTIVSLGTTAVTPPTMTGGAAATAGNLTNVLSGSGTATVISISTWVTTAAVPVYILPVVVTGGDAYLNCIVSIVPSNLVSVAAPEPIEKVVERMVLAKMAQLHLNVPDDSVRSLENSDDELAHHSSSSVH
jgi:hypothetical protein